MHLRTRNRRCILSAVSAFWRARAETRRRYRATVDESASANSSTKDPSWVICAHVLGEVGVGDVLGWEKM